MQLSAMEYLRWIFGPSDETFLKWVNEEDLPRLRRALGKYPDLANIRLKVCDP